MTAGLFDDLTDVYDAMIDWPKRLAYEEPFFRSVFDRAGAERIVDVACGTGRHVAMFHSWGLDVEGSDISPNMIDRARASFGQSDRLRWAVRAFDEPIRTARPFDVALCVGNSLALAPDFAVIRRALHEMMAAVRPGGLLVLQVLNLWRLTDGPCQWQKARRTTLNEEEVLIVKGVHRCGSRGFVDLFVTPLPDIELHGDTAVFQGLEAVDLEQAAREEGASSVECLGSYRRDSYDRRTSGDLILIAQKLATPDRHE
ncbi:MAG: methyltransferase domain-containing protein [Rhodopirellula sp.]|nr:methyltransferase domain-containing protein [Rhodopirellula sp.]